MIILEIADLLFVKISNKHYRNCALLTQKRKDLKEM